MNGMLEGLGNARGNINVMASWACKDPSELWRGHATIRRCPNTLDQK